MIQIIIADDHKLFRETLGEFLQSHKDIEVVALCQDSTEAIETVRSDKPDLVLLDMKMSPLSGVATASAIAGFSDTKMIGLSMYSNTSYARNMFKAGAQGYITKNTSIQEIITGIYAVMRGERYLCQEIKDMMAEEALQPGHTKAASTRLTARELEVVKLISQGHSSRQIADKLGVNYKTIEAHRHNMLQKLHLKNSNELINYFNNHEDYFL